VFNTSEIRSHPVRTRYGVDRLYRRRATFGGQTHYTTAQVIIFAESNMEALTEFSTTAFASAPHEPGRLWQWRRLSPHWDTTTSGTPANWSTLPITGNIQWSQGTAQDAVGGSRYYNPCPAGWRVPFYGELILLERTSTSVWTNQNGVNGVRFTNNATGQALFFPAAGQRTPSGALQNTDTAVYIWSANTVGSDGPATTNPVRYIRAHSGGVEFRDAPFSDRHAARTVRCVMH
jgi:hypothetical protein